VWKRYCKQQYPELSAVALKLLSVHGTSAATERNWALWGRLYTASRNQLGMERAKKLITFCFNSRAEAPRTDDFGLLLSVVEGSADV
jgi:hAT family C-terminal dimerisation region